jgi:predicted ester cyclase
MVASNPVEFPTDAAVPPPVLMTVWIGSQRFQRAVIRTPWVQPGCALRPPGAAEDSLSGQEGPVFTGASRGKAGIMTTAEDMMEIQTRWAEEVINQGRLEVLDEILAPGIVDHDPAPDQGPGPEGFKGFFAAMRAAFPDIHVSGETMVVDGDFRGLQIARFADGKAVERWGSSDQLGLLQQLGAIDMPG